MGVISKISKEALRPKNIKTYFNPVISLAVLGLGPVLLGKNVKLGFFFKKINTIIFGILFKIITLFTFIYIFKIVI